MDCACLKGLCKLADAAGELSSLNTAQPCPAPELPIPNKGVHGHRAVDLSYDFFFASCKFLSNELHLSEETCSNAI